MLWCVLLVPPSVVLLDNHTAAKLGKVNCYGWKWEVKPNIAEPWRGYCANYLALNSYDIRLSPFHLLYSGWINVGSMDLSGSHGFLWPSTNYNVTQVYNLGFHSGAVYPSYSHERHHGFSIRCLAR